MMRRAEKAIKDGIVCSEFSGEGDDIVKLFADILCEDRVGKDLNACFCYTLDRFAGFCKGILCLHKGIMGCGILAVQADEQACQIVAGLKEGE